MPELPGATLPPPANPARRRLLKYGLASAAIIAVAPFAVRRQPPAVAAGFVHLRERDVAIWRALIPALLADALPEASAQREPLIAEILLRIDGALGLLRPPLRQATLDMLDFVDLAPPRGLSGGYWGRWRDASVAEASAVLESWSTSRLELLRACYRSLHDFVMGAWYAMPQSWSAIGYPGPPAVARA